MSIGQQPRQSDSDRGTMSSSSGTPSDQHRSPALNQNGWSSSGQAVKGWTPPSSNQPLPQGMQNAPGPTGMSGYTTANPSNKPVNVDYAWTAPPQQSNIYNYNHNDNGRPLSPDGWPVRKEAIRGHTEPVPDLLSGYIQKKEAAAVPGKSSGWKTTSSNVSRNTITAAKDTPLPLSEVDNRGLSRPPRHVPSPGPSPPAQTAPAASNWRTSTPKSVKSPVLVAPIAPVPIAPVHVSGAVQTAALAPTSASANSPPNNAQDRPTSQTVRVVSGWTVKVPFGRDEDVVAVLPVPIVPQQYSQQPSQQNIASSSTAPPEEPSSDATEAWVLPSVDAVKNNNWTSTTRRSRVSRVEQTPTYIRASSPGRKESDFITSDGRGHGYSASGSRFGNDDNSIRPSESASNVGVADETSYGRSDRQPVSQDRNSQAHPRFKPMRQFQGEKDTDIGSNASSGSLNDNPNAMAGGWQRSTAAHVVHETMDRQPAFEMSKSPGYNSHASQHHQPQLHNLRQGEPPGLQGRYAQQYANGESRRTPITAPMPRRWDSSSQKLVGDLERAATPRMAQGVSAGTGHGRSTSTTSGAKGSMSIRGASKYHAESLMLREEVSRCTSRPIIVITKLTHASLQLDKIRSQVAKYETVLSSLDSAEDRHDAELEREVQTLKQENHDLRSRVGQLEAERDEMRNALQPVLRVLGLIAGKTQKNGGHADHLGDYINGHASTSLQDLTMISKGDVSRQTQPRAVGW